MYVIHNIPFLNFLLYSTYSLFLSLLLAVDFLTVVWMLSILSLRDQRNPCLCPILREFTAATSLTSPLTPVVDHHPLLTILQVLVMDFLSQTHGRQIQGSLLEEAVYTLGEMRM